PPVTDRGDVLPVEGGAGRAHPPGRAAGGVRGELRRRPRGAREDPRPPALPDELRAERPQAHARGRAARGDHCRRARGVAEPVEAVLRIAADAISASRPGARGESLEHYIKRLEALEELAGRHAGVEKVYALQAGREIRVLVKPTEIDDDGAVLLSHEIAREIEG